MPFGPAPFPLVPQQRAVQVILVLSVAVGLFTSTVVMTGSASASVVPPPVVREQCAADLSEAERAQVLAATDTSALTLANAEERAGLLRSIYVGHGDHKGLMAIFYSEVLGDLVPQVQAGNYADPAWAERITLEFFAEYLDQLHHWVAGEATDPGWSYAYQLAEDCTRTVGRAAAGLVSTHIVEDLPKALHAAEAKPDNLGDFMLMGEQLVAVIDGIVAGVQQSYGQDLAAVFHLYLAGQIFNAFTGPQMTETLLLQAVRASAWSDGLMLLDPYWHYVGAFLIQWKWQLGQAVMDGFEQGGLL